MSHCREILEKKFAEEYQKLNPRQRIAVDTIEGPVMVIAGPGTGKTQILAARIGKILLDTDARPNEILCLTYTDAGAVSMRKRLFEFIGPDAYRINIYTFHAFCNEVIQENLEYFGKLNLEAISDLESAMLFRRLVDDFANDHLLKRFTGDTYFDTKRLKDLFSSMKSENWSEEDFYRAIDEYIAAIDNCDTDSEYYSKYYYKRKSGNNQVGDKKAAYADMLDKMAKLKV